MFNLTLRDIMKEKVYHLESKFYSTTCLAALEVAGEHNPDLLDTNLK